MRDKRYRGPEVETDQEREETQLRELADRVEAVRHAHATVRINIASAIVASACATMMHAMPAETDEYTRHKVVTRALALADALIEASGWEP